MASNFIKPTYLTTYCHWWTTPKTEHIMRCNMDIDQTLLYQTSETDSFDLIYHFASDTNSHLFITTLLYTSWEVHYYLKEALKLLQAYSYSK